MEARGARLIFPRDGERANDQISFERLDAGLEIPILARFELSCRAAPQGRREMIQCDDFIAR